MDEEGAAAAARRGSVAFVLRREQQPELDVLVFCSKLVSTRSDRAAASPGAMRPPARREACGREPRLVVIEEVLPLDVLKEDDEEEGKGSLDVVPSMASASASRRACTCCHLCSMLLGMQPNTSSYTLVLAVASSCRVVV